MPTLIVVAVCAVFVLTGFLAPGLLNGAFDLVDSALGWMGPFWAVTVVSAVTGVLFIMAFPHISLQSQIVAVKDRIKHHVLSIRIFQDEMRVVARGVAGSLGWNLAYLGLNVVPVVVLALPFIFVWCQLNALYAFSPLDPGDRLVVVAELRSGVDPATVELVAPEGGTIVNRANMVGGIAFTLRADEDASSVITLRHDGREVTKDFEVGSDPRRLSRLRTSQPWTNFAAARDPILYFGSEPVLPADSFVEAIDVQYPPAPLGPFEGGEIPIMILFVIVTMVVGFALKDFFGVEL